ncbi:MAG: hypothetical protein HY225_00755, partial [Candidatus Vogelbacteria bacterium]|nr:hypothetical protein [Candidatus Vogelbacteria bacterium]
MSEKTRFEHVEFDSLAEVNIYFKEHELIKPLGEDGWGIARVQYPDNIYSQYYVFTAFNLSTNKEVTGIHRAIVLVEACSLFERSIIEDMEINHQPGSGVEIADEDDDSESVSTDGG